MSDPIRVSRRATAGCEPISASRKKNWRRLASVVKNRYSSNIRLLLDAAFASALRGFPVHRLCRQVFVRPHEPLADGRGVAHESRHGRVVLLAVLQPTDDRPVQARALGHVADAQT